MTLADGREILADGSPVGGVLQVNTYNTSYQINPTVAGANGHFVVAWRSDGSFGTDLDDSIQGQRLMGHALVFADGFTQEFAEPVLSSVHDPLVTVAVEPHSPYLCAPDLLTRAADIAPPRLLARLAPVAQALRLVPEDSEGTYYKLLGVPPESDATLIRQAYRRRARDLHPDLQPEQAADPQAFTRLTTAYRTLRDPVAKDAYDARHNLDGTWFEPEPPSQPVQSRRRARFTAVIVVVVLLVAATLVLDQLYREQARQSAYRTSQIEVTRPVVPPPTAAVPDGPSRVVESIPPAPAEIPATMAAAPIPADVSPEITPVALALAPSPTEPTPVSPESAPAASKPIAATDPPTPPETTLNDDTRAADHRRVAVFYTSQKDGQLAEKLAAFLAASSAAASVKLSWRAAAEKACSMLMLGKRRCCSLISITLSH